MTTCKVFYEQINIVKWNSKTMLIATKIEPKCWCVECIIDTHQNCFRFSIHFPWTMLTGGETWKSCKTDLSSLVSMDTINAISIYQEPFTSDAQSCMAIAGVLSVLIHYDCFPISCMDDNNERTIHNEFLQFEILCFVQIVSFSIESMTNQYYTSCCISNAWPIHFCKT